MIINENTIVCYILQDVKLLFEDIKPKIHNK